MPAAGSITGPTSVCEGATITLVDAATGGTWSVSNTNATVSGAGVVTGITTGFVTISYTVTNSCTSLSATAIITINAAPNPGVITGPSSVCIGTTITLSDAVPGGTWSLTNSHASIAGGVVTPNTAGIDTIMYSVTNGCGTATASWPVTINALPDAGTISGPSGVCIGANITLTNSVSGGAWSASNGRATISGGVVTGVSAGIDTIIYSTTGACGAASATKIITVAPVPGGGSLSGASSVCVGGAITITSTVSGGVWSRTNAHASVSTSGIVTGLSTGRDTIIYTVTNSCGSGISSKTITVTGAGTAGTILGQSTVCAGDHLTLTDAIAGGIWTTTNPLIATVDGGGIVTGVAAGSATIDYTVSGSCGSSVATHGVVVRSQADCSGTASGITQTTTGENDIRIAPNPSKGDFTISGTFSSVIGDEVIIEITNMLGQTIYTGKATTHGGTIDEQVQLNNPSNGMYLLSLRTGDIKQIFRIVITR